MKIQLKRSNVLEGGSAKEPTPEQMEYGELAVNYNENDPSLFIKDSGNNIVKIASGDIVLDVNLGYTANGNSAGTVTNTAGADATIPVATNTVAGLFTGTEKQKLNGLNTNSDNDTRYLRIDSGAGNQTVNSTGTTTFNGPLSVTGAIVASDDVTAFSDISLKENIQVITGALDKVSQLRGVTYNRIDIQGKRQAGVIAQEVETVLPEVVNTNENGIKSVAYGNIVGLLIESIKELKAEVETLKKEQN